LATAPAWRADVNHSTSAPCLSHFIGKIGN